MASLTLVHWLLIGNLALLVVVGGFMWSLWRQQQLEQVRVNESLVALDEASQAVSRSTIGMGRRIKQIESRFQKVEQKAVLPNADDATFEQASRLVGLGATAAELVDNCGMARGEAELLVSLKRQ
ncbi:MAG: DUF2802 domain-containing protein [Saccharospirillaceae bacterium]|jgi:preprotein translocase subunit YajC|nr:hypothetical protein A3759_04515 [Thalassolituus sp. HI0120]MCH2041614.1 DUF2802 domain-containing protein [Saccharospirillaceae bacterium]